MSGDQECQSNVVQLELTLHTARRIITEIILDSSRVIYTTHARQRMKQRKVLTSQVRSVLKHGRISEGPARSVNGNWEMTMDGIAAGDHLSIPVALDHDEGTGNYVLIVTVIIKN